MKVLAFGTILAGLLCGVGAVSLHGQGTFQNLDFEQATVPTVPSGGFGSLEPISAALPFWNGYLGNTSQTITYHNNYSLGAPALGILGPVWSRPPVVIEGSYSAVLQAGALFQDNYASASIAQVGLVPGSAKSIQVKVQPIFFTTDPAIQFNVSLDGQNIPLRYLASTSGYTLLGGDISSFAGQARSLRLAALPIPADPFSSFAVDSIIFSDQVIPEPSAFCLVGFGAWFLGWRLSCRRK
jgi:hypothetical protein